MKKIFSILLLSSFMFTFTSCQSYLDVNKNEDAPDKISPELYLAGILDVWQGIYDDNRFANSMSHVQGNGNNWASHSYSASSDTGGEMWRVNYWLQGVNLENMINQSLEKEAYTLAGIGYIIKAYSWDWCTKDHGEMPMKQAYQSGILSFDYDYQEEIYTQVREWAKTGIELLEREDNTEYGNTLKELDLIFAGDKSKWIKFGHGVIVINLSSLTQKNDFQSAYYQELVDHARLSLSSADDDVTLMTVGGRGDAQFSDYNNKWGPYRGTGTDGYYPTEFTVQIMTGTLPLYDKLTGDKVDASYPSGEEDENYPFELSPIQYVTDTSKVVGHFDPRRTAKIGSRDARFYKDMTNKDSIKSWIYYGSSRGGGAGSITTPANLWGSRAGYSSTSSVDGDGRWLYRNDAPYILMTAAEIQFCLAEAEFVVGNKSAALAAFKKGVALDCDFTAKYLVPGKPKVTGEDADGKPIYAQYGELPGGDVIAVATFKELANEYIEGPYVNGMTEADLTISHIMLQKLVALFPWGGIETWTDMRKYHYDINHTGDYPKLNNGWTLTTVDQKWDDDPTKVYKGFYLAPAQVEGCRSSYNTKNEGSPAFRVRPRYNSEYMWNRAGLDAIKPISGLADNYHCSIPWFAYPGDYPESL